MCSTTRAKIDCSGGIGWLYKELLGRRSPWCDCCIAHDKLYRRGGDRHTRRLADWKLRVCVTKASGPVVGIVFFYAVRWFGWPYFNWRD